MELNSKRVTVNKSAEELCTFLADAKNFKQIMPENINKFEMIKDDAFVFQLAGMPEIALKVKEVNKPNEVILGALSDKLNFTLTADIQEIDSTSSSAALIFEGSFNTMMKMMIKGPITKFLETLSTNLSKL